MPNKGIPDWKKAVIVALSSKYGQNAIARKLDIHPNTVKKYREKAEEQGRLETSGPDMEIVQ